MNPNLRAYRLCQAELKPGERLVDLERDGLWIIQKQEGFCFGTDSVLLAGFAKAWRQDKAVDLCCGSGIIPILMSARCPGTCFYGIEIQEAAADMAGRSVQMNGLNSRIKIVQGDIRHFHESLNPHTFDVVTVNPPYMKTSGPNTPLTERNIARHEVFCGIEDVAAASAKLLKYGGKLYMVHRTQRLTDVICALRAQNLEPKELRFVHPFANTAPKIFLISAVKGAAPGLNDVRPLIMYKEPGVYSDEVKEIYKS